MLIVLVLIVVRILLFAYLPLYVLRVAALAFACMQHIFCYMFGVSVVVVVVHGIYLFCCKYTFTLMHINTNTHMRTYVCACLHLFSPC